MKNKETLEEAASKYVDNFEYSIAHPIRVCKNAFINGAKWQQERSYSEEDLKEAFTEGRESSWDFKEWWEQFKKK